MRFAVLVAVAALATVAAQPPCDAGWTYFPDVDGIEDGAAPKTLNGVARDKFTGSCLRLFKNNDPGVFIFYDPATSTRSFPVLARSYCGFQNSGGRLVSFNSLNSSSASLLNAIKTLTAGASTTLVLVGGFQSPNLKNGVFAKNANWIWTDAYTSSAVIANGNWAPGQPDDAQNSAADGSVVGPVPAQENATANFLAMHKTTGQFYDISGTQKMDFVCQYRAPAPCSEGYRYFSPAGLDPNNEYGMASCVKVFKTPATLQDARDTCGLLKAQPLNPFVVYAHLATYHAVVTGEPVTPLTAFVKTMARRKGIAGTRFWTGGQLILTGSDFIPSWQDNRPFDSTLVIGPAPSPDSSDGYEIVLNIGNSTTAPQLETYIDPEGTSTLPFVCEADVAIRIETLSSGSSLSTGKVLTYGAKTAGSMDTLADAQPICRINFGSSSGNVVCKERGFDKGRALSSDLTQQENGMAPRANTAANCMGSEGFGADCGNIQAVVFSAQGCADPHITVIDCANEDMVPGQFATSSGAGDLTTTTSSNSNLSNSDMAITIVVVVVGAFLIVLASVYIVKGVRSLKRTSGHTVLPSPTPKTSGGDGEGHPAAGTSASPVTIRAAERAEAV